MVNGAVSNSYDLSAVPDGVNDITVGMSAQAGNVWANDPNSGTLTPAINQTMTGGLLPAQNSLNLAANLHTNSNLTIRISFTGTQPGADNVSFTIFDIDLTADRDLISNIYGVAPDGTHIAATITNLGSNVNLGGGGGLAQTLTSTLPSLNNTSLGNATISFGSNLITDVYFTFSNTAGPPRFQDIGIGDISFTPVPEINPAATSAISCLVAFGLTVWVQRRAKLKARGLPAARF